MGQDVVASIVDAFARTSKLSRNRLSYVLEEVGRALYEREWRFKIVKTGTSLRTMFDSKDSDENGDGDNHESLQESAPLN